MNKIVRTRQILIIIISSVISVRIAKSISCLLVFFMVFLQKGLSAQTALSKKLSDEQVTKLIANSNKPIAFIENKGQWPDHVLMKADVPGGQMLATPQGMLIGLFDPASMTAVSKYDMALEEIQTGKMPGMSVSDLGPAPQLKGFGWKLKFLGATDANAKTILKQDENTDFSNYLTGAASALNVHSYNVITYTNVYPNVDVKYYTASGGSLENDIIAKPGSNPSLINVLVDGVSELSVDSKGALILPTPLGKMSVASPISYTVDNKGKRTSINIKYKLTGKNSFGFEIPEFDKSQTLIIDPIVMRWASWIASNSSVASHCHGVDLDGSGNIYVVSRGGNGLVTVGAFQTAYTGVAGSVILWISKYVEPSVPGGSGTCVWQTYLGGTSTTNPYACAVGADGYLYIAGVTNDNLNTTYGTGAPIPTWTQRTTIGTGGQQVFIAKVAPSGSWAQVRDIGSATANLNPNLYDLRTIPNTGGTFDLIAAGYVTQQTTTSADGDIPVAQYPNGTAVTTGGGKVNGYALRLSSDLTTLRWAKQYTTAGNNNQFFTSAADGTGTILLGGNTNGSSNVSYVNTTQNALGGTQDGWLMSINGATGNANWSRYFNSAAGKTTSILCMEVNQQRTNFVIGGLTTGLNAANISAGAYQTTYPGSIGKDFFIASLPIAATSLNWGTYFGGNGNNNADNMMGLNLDQNNDVYVLGYTNSKFTPTTIPAAGNPIQTSAYDPTNYDAIFFKLSGSTGDSLLFYTYLGGKSNEEDPTGERGIKFNNCRIYLAITSESNDFPLTRGTYDSIYTPVTGSTYLPLIVSMANPPDLLNNNITSGGTQTVACGQAPQLITASTPTYIIPTIIRNSVGQANGSAGAYPLGLPVISSYQWQFSTNNGNSWTSIPGATTQNYTPAPIDSFTGTYLFRRIINGDYCSLTGDTLDIVTVTVTPAYAPPAITTNSPLCAGQTLTLATPSQTGYTYLWTGPGSFVSHAQDTSVTNVSTSSVGVYFLTVRNTANGCVSYPDSALVAITNPLPAPVASSNSPVCTNGQLSLFAAGTGNTFSWTGPNGFTSTLQNPTIANATSVNAGTYFVTQSNGGSCVSPPASVVVVIDSIATAVAGSNSPVCTGGVVNLTATSVTGAVYSWTGPNGFSSTQQNPNISNVTANVAGSYTVTTTVNGCSGAASSVTVNIIAAPSAPMVTNNGPVCQGSTLLLNSGNIAGATFLWGGPNGFLSTIQNPTITNIIPGDSGVYYVIATISGCASDTGKTTVIVNGTPPTPALHSNTPICQGGNLNLFADTIAGASYTWTGPNGFTSTVQNPLITNISSVQTGTYNLQVTVNGCQSQVATIAVTVNTTATTIATSNSPVCAGGTLNLFATNVTGGNFNWTGPNGFVSALQNPTIANVTLADSGTYIVNVIAKGCYSQTPGTVQVVVTQTPAPVATNNGPLCAGDTLILSASSVSGASYVWRNASGIVSNQQVVVIPNATVLDSGLYAVNAFVTGCNASTRSITDVIINPRPTGAITSNSPVCEGQPINLTATADSAATFTWIGPNGFTSSNQNPVINPSILADSGAYSITLTVKGCQNTIPLATTVIVNPLPQAPTAVNSGPLCTGDTLFLNVNGVAGATYSWTGPNGFTSTYQNPYIANASSANAGVYNVFGTLNGCVGGSGTTTVIINPIPVIVSATSNSPVCQGGTITLNTPVVSGSSYNWTGPNGFISNLATVNINNAVLVDSGVYVLTEKINGCSSAADSITVNILALPNPPSASSNSPVCSGDTLFLTAQSSSGSSFSWTGPNGFTSTLQNPFVANASPANDGTYTVIASANGCLGSSAQVSVVVGNKPSVSFTSNAPQCVGQPVGFTNTGTTGSGITYKWNFGSGAMPDSSTISNPIGVVYSTGGNKTVVFTISNGLCAVSDTQTILITGQPQAHFVNNGPACFPPGVITFTDSSLGSISTWFWNFGAGATPATATGPGPIAVTYANPGVQNITLTVTSGGCSSTTTETADVGVIGADFTSSVPQNGDNGCLGQPVNFYTIGNNGTGAANYWNFGDGAVPQTSTATNPANILYTTTGAKIVTHIVSGGSCIKPDTIIHIVTINPIPTTSFTSSAPVCANVPVSFTNTGSTGVNYSFFWDFGANASPPTSTAENPQGVVYSTSGTKTVTFSITNGFYCVVQIGQSIVINQTPTASFTSDAPQCTNQPVTFTNTGTLNGVNWLWTFGRDADSSNSVLQNPTGITFGTAGVQVVSLIATDANSGCADTVVNSIIINQNPQASFVSNAPQCSAQGINFTNTGSTGGIWSYSWNFGQGASPSVSVAENPNAIIYSYGGNKTVTLTVSGGGCTQTVSEIVPVDSTPVAAFTSTATQCTGDTINFTNTGSNAGVTYSWNFGAGAVPSSSNIASPTGIIYSTPGTKLVTLTVTNILTGCQATTTTTFNVNQAPVVSFASNAPQCLNVPINFNNTGSTGGSWSYNWNFGVGSNPSGSSAENPSGIQYSSSGAKLITLTVSGGGCTITKTQSIVINATPVAGIASNAPRCTGQPVNFSNTGSLTGVNVLWNFGAGSTPDSSDLQNPTGIVFNNAGITTATLNVTDTVSGCTATASQNFTINQTPVASFTSNAPQCAIVPINFTNTGSIGNNWSYNWDLGQGAIPAYSASINPAGILYTSAGSKVITLTISSQFCTQTTTQTIVINPTPVASFITTGPQCTGLGVNFDNTGSNAGVTYSWNFGSGAIPATDTIQNPAGVTYSSAGSKIISLTTTDTASGCSVTATNTLVIHQTPTATFTSNAPQCSNVPINFTNTGSTGNNWSYNWDFGQDAVPALSSSQNPSGILYSSSGTKTVTFIISDQNCNQTSTQNIIINSTPKAAFITTAPQCTGLGVDFTNLGSSSNVTWAWNFGANALPPISKVFNPSGVVYDTAGSKTVTLVITDTTSGCSATATSSFVIHQTPTASFISNAPQCSNVPVNFTNTGSTGTNWYYSWNFGQNAVPAASSGANPSGVLYSSSGPKVITFTISDQNCTQTIADTIVINTTPTASFTSTAPQCTGSPVNFNNTGSVNGVNWLWDFGAGAAPATSSLSSPTGIVYSTAGTQTVTFTITDTTSGCSAVATVPILIHQTPAVSFASNAPRCAGSAVNFTNTGSTGSNWSYAWNFGVGSSPSTSTGESPGGILYGSAGTKNVTFTISDQNCTNTYSDTLIILVTPVASFTSNAPKCTGLPVNFVNTGTSAGVTWLWNFGNNATPSSDTTQYPTIIYNTSGITNVTLTISDLSSSCTATVTSQINIYQTPTATFTSSAPQCTNTPVNFVNTGTTGGNWTYAWDFGQSAQPSVSSSQNPTGITYDSAGAKYVTFTISDATCAQSITDTIAIKSTPVASFTSSAPQCSGLPVSFTNTGSVSGVNWLWNFGAGATPTSSNLSNPVGVAFGSAGIIPVTLTITDSSSACSATATNNIVIYQTPTATFNSNAPQCTNVAVNFTNTGSTGSNWSYAWDFGQNAIPAVSSSENTNGVLYDSSGFKVVTFTISDAHCSQTKVDTIIINRTPKASFTSTAPECSGLPVSFTNTGSTSGVTWGWSFGSGAQPTGSTLQNPSGIVFSTSGINTISLTITDSSTACAAFSTNTINIYQTPTASFAANAPQCANSPVNFTNTGSTGNNWTYSWDFGQNASPSVSSSENTAGVLYDSSGSKTVTFVISDAHCSNSITQTIIVSPLPIANAGLDTTICANTSVVLGGVNQTPGATYIWFPSSTLDNAHVPNPVANPTASITNYSVTVTDPSTGCSKSDYVVITMLNPLIANAGVNAEICFGDSVQIGLGLVEGQFYSWAPSTGLNDPLSPNPIANPSQTTTYTLVVSDTTGCKPVTDNVTVIVNPLPSANAGPDDTIQVGGSVQLTGTGGVQYVWNPVTGLDNANIFNPIAKPDSTTNYVLTVTNVFGCHNTDTVLVFVYNFDNPWWVPSAFSPNGDGHNDMLFVRGGVFEIFEFSIFNRYGELMFDSKNINEGWDGKAPGGQPAPMDAYVYKIHGLLSDGRIIDVKGLVNLVR